MSCLSYLVQTLEIVKVLADAHLPVHVDPLEDPRLGPGKHVKVLLLLLLLLPSLRHSVSENQSGKMQNIKPSLFQFLLHNIYKLGERGLHEMAPK